MISNNKFTIIKSSVNSCNIALLMESTLYNAIVVNNETKRSWWVYDYRDSFLIERAIKELLLPDGGW